MEMEEKSCWEFGSSWKEQPIFMYEILKQEVLKLQVNRVELVHDLECILHGGKCQEMKHCMEIRLKRKSAD